MARRVNVRQLRESAGLSREHFAKRLGVGQRSVYRWEAGDYIPSNMAEEKLKAFAAEHKNGKAQVTHTPARVRAELTEQNAPSTPEPVPGTPFSRE